MKRYFNGYNENFLIILQLSRKLKKAIFPFSKCPATLLTDFTDKWSHSVRSLFPTLPLPICVT